MRKTLLAMGAAVAVAVAARRQLAQQTIKIGLICPYSGQFADAGDPDATTASRPT